MDNMRAVAYICVLAQCFAFSAALAQSNPIHNPSHIPIDAAIASERMPADRVEDAWRKPREVLTFLEVAPGQHVLDFYAGPGYYSELISRIVGPTG
ncbi:MAG: methyltransferase, partial [Candidatus Obscuribacterales bacterium]|nr:methyltransferase [Steroidobacteraceae bacterium]